MEMKQLSVGDEFIHIGPDEFAEINKAANAQGLMAIIFELEGDAGSPEMLISFEIVEK